MASLIQFLASLTQSLAFLETHWKAKLWPQKNITTGLSAQVCYAEKGVKNIHVIVIHSQMRHLGRMCTLEVDVLTVLKQIDWRGMSFKWTNITLAVFDKAATSLTSSARRYSPVLATGPREGAFKSTEHLTWMQFY